MATVTVTARIKLECENMEVPQDAIIDNFIAAINNQVPLWQALPHDPRSTIWATKAKLVKVYEREPK